MIIVAAIFIWFYLFIKGLVYLVFWFFYGIAMLIALMIRGIVELTKLARSM